jgi:hypothetical protein
MDFILHRYAISLGSPRMLSELGRREKLVWTSVGETMPVAWVSLALQNEKRSSQPERASLHFRGLSRREATSVGVCPYRNR